MAAKGWNVNQQLVVNLVFATMCPLGAILFALGLESMVASRDMILGVSLAFSAGVFLCISLGDLLPELSLARSIAAFDDACAGSVVGAGHRVPTRSQSLTTCEISFVDWRLSLLSC